MEQTPTEQQITDWLTTTGRPTTWAASLTGLPWTYIRPVVEIAANTNVHPTVALTVARAHSSDPDFVATATAHLTTTGAIP